MQEMQEGNIKKEFMSPQVLILFGPPGSGKGVQATLLSERLNLYHLEPSKIIEGYVMTAKKGDFIRVKGERYFLVKEKKFWETGKLCTPVVVNFWLKNKIEELVRLKKDLLIEGAPRDLIQAKEIIPFIKKLYGPKNIKVVFLEISAEETIWRNSHRRICQLMRHSILYSPETQNLKYCPLDGSRLIKRKGLDDPKTIKVRLKEYKEKTLPVIRYFEKEKLKVKTVDGSPPPAEVFKTILKLVK